MKLKRILVLTDNLYLYKKFQQIVKSKNIKDAVFDYYYSYNNSHFAKIFQEDPKFKSLNINNEVAIIVQKYNLIISLHCKQLFPKKLMEQIRCINIHPGFNPYNRGWFPQVFSIINNLPLGATIHEMDGEIDHGPIIAQKQVPVYSYDTSLSAYKRVIKTELELIDKYIEVLVRNEYQTKMSSQEGNLNYQRDFERICLFNLEEKGTFKYFLDKLRALSHGDYKNAYFIDPKTNKRVFVKINMEPEEQK